MLSSQETSNRRSATAALHAVADTHAALYYAGAAFATPASQRHVPGRYLGENLAQAAE